MLEDCLVFQVKVYQFINNILTHLIHLNVLQEDMITNFYMVMQQRLFNFTLVLTYLYVAKVTLVKGLFTRIIKLHRVQYTVGAFHFAALD